MSAGHSTQLRRMLMTCLLACAAVLALGGCSTLAPQASLATAPSPTAQANQAATQGLIDFEALQQGLAEDAERQGHWTQAAWHWDAVLALRPDDANITARQQRALQAADSLAALRVSQARLALQLGDAESARELLLRALAVQPDLPEAAESLRKIEHERMREQAAQVVSRHRPGRKARLPAIHEHAQMLALQGHLDEAAALLRPLAEAKPPDRAARRRLADYLLLLAQRQYATDPAAAMRTARRSLQLDPGLRAARQALRDWQRAAARPSGGRTAP